MLHCGENTWHRIFKHTFSDVSVKANGICNIFALLKDENSTPNNGGGKVRVEDCTKEGFLTMNKRINYHTYELVNHVQEDKTVVYQYRYITKYCTVYKHLVESSYTMCCLVSTVPYNFVPKFSLMLCYFCLFLDVLPFKN